MHLDLDAPRRVRAQVSLQQREGLARVLVGRDAASRSWRRRAGTSVLDDVATEGASMPIVVIDGLVQIRDSSEPVPIVCTPSSSPDSARSRSSA